MALLVSSPRPLNSAPATRPYVIVISFHRLIPRINVTHEHYGETSVPILLTITDYTGSIRTRRDYITETSIVIVITPRDIQMPRNAEFYGRTVSFTRRLAGTHPCRTGRSGRRVLAESMRNKAPG